MAREPCVALHAMPEQNKAKAVELFEQAHAWATFNLGVMYFNGDGVEQNKAKAVELYEQAHAAGHGWAACKLLFVLSVI